MEKVCKIKHPVYYLLTIFILFNCAGSPPAPIPESVPEVVKRTTAIAPNPPKSILIRSIESVSYTHLTLPTTPYV